MYSKSTCFDTFPFPDLSTNPALSAQIAKFAEQIDAHRKRAQAAHPGVATLTGMYNVLEALRQGRPLTAKEQAIHTAGTVSVLRELHAALNTAVLSAYGWADLSPGLSLGPLTCPAEGEPNPEFEAAKAKLLTRLVALNTQRATEEATGQMRYLRPDFQDPELRKLRETAANQSLQNSEQQSEPIRRQQGNLSLNLAVDDSPAPTKPGKPQKPTTPWPATLPEQVKAVADALNTKPTSLAELQAQFKGKGPWKKGLPTILATLQALGRAQVSGVGDAAVWRV